MTEPFTPAHAPVAKLCRCGAGKPRRELVDARGIFCGFVCDSCEAAKRAEFRPDIFSDPDYPASEPITDD